MKSTRKSGPKPKVLVVTILLVMTRMLKRHRLITHGAVLSVDLEVICPHQSARRGQDPGPAQGHPIEDITKNQRSTGHAQDHLETTRKITNGKVTLDLEVLLHTNLGKRETGKDPSPPATIVIARMTATLTDTMTSTTKIENTKMIGIPSAIETEIVDMTSTTIKKIGIPKSMKIPKSTIGTINTEIGRINIRIETINIEIGTISIRIEKISIRRKSTKSLNTGTRRGRRADQRIGGEEARTERNCSFK